MRNTGVIVGILLVLGLIGNFFGDQNNSTQSSQRQSTNQKSPNEYDFTVDQTTKPSGEINWIFTGKMRPPLNLSEPNTFIQSVNKILGVLKLPEVKKAVPELEELTHQRGDRTYYQWEDYEGGRLVVQRDLCSKGFKQDYDCIRRIKLISNGKNPPK